MNILNIDINVIQTILKYTHEIFPKIDIIGLSCVDSSSNEKTILNNLYRIKEIVDYAIKEEESKQNLIPLA